MRTLFAFLLLFCSLGFAGTIGDIFTRSVRTTKSPITVLEMITEIIDKNKGLKTKALQQKVMDGICKKNGPVRKAAGVSCENEVIFYLADSICTKREARDDARGKYGFKGSQCFKKGMKKYFKGKDEAPMGQVGKKLKQFFETDLNKDQKQAALKKICGAGLLDFSTHKAVGCP